MKVRYTLLRSGAVVRNHGLEGNDWRSSWWCMPRECHAEKDVPCPCGRRGGLAFDNGDPGDEDPLARTREKAEG